MAKRFPEEIKEYPLSMQIFIILISNRIDKGKNSLIGVFGQTGGGKSLAVLQIMRGLYLYRNGVEPLNEYLMDHIFFKAKPFMQRMKEISDQLVNDPTKVVRGEGWLWDEGGIDAGHKDALTIKNKIVGWLAQTFRNLGQVVFFTTPSIHFLDKTVRTLLHYYLEAVSIDKKKQICIIKPLEIQYNSRMDKIYYHNLTYPTKEGLMEVEFMGVPRINPLLERSYEIKKNAFTQNLNSQILMMLTKIDDKDNPENKLTDRQKDILHLMKEGCVSTGKIAEKLGLKDYMVSTSITSMRKKGIDIKSLRESAKLGVLG